MGMVFGKISEELPKHTVLYRPALAAFDFEVRLYEPAVAAASAYGAGGWRSDRKGDRRPFGNLARYIGVFSRPANKASGSGAAVPISMTAPVFIKAGEDEAEADPALEAKAGAPKKITMTAPVLIGEQGEQTTMMFVLPGSKYTTVAEAPVPTDPAVHLVQLPARTMAARTFNGPMRAERCKEQLAALLADLHADGRYVARRAPTGAVEWQAAGYNAPFTLDHFKTNEVLVNVDEAEKSDQRA